MNNKICFVFALALVDIALSTESSSGALPLGVVAPCNLGDMECLKKSTELFLSQTYKGISAHDILTIDPINIESLDVASGSKTILNRNITVTGLAHQKLHDFKMDVETGSVALTTSADININGDATLVFNEESRTVSGQFWTYGHVLGKALYSYTLQTDNKGVEHFVVGPETITCETEGTPVVVFYSNLADLCHDGLCPEEIKQLMKRNFCEIVEKAYTVVVHNIRAAAKALPSTAFFNNLHNK